MGKGGTTTLWVDRERKLTRSFASLSGTYRNCAGGRTPWGTWLSCEECTYVPGPLDPHNADQRPDVSKPHGFVFEVDARATDLVDPVPIAGMGRFYHEAVAVDPATGFVYLSEDRNDGLLYRYRADVLTRKEKTPRTMKPGDLAKGGVLEALRIAGKPKAKTQNWKDDEKSFTPGRRFAIEWVKMPAIDAEVDMERDPTDPNPDSLGKRGRTSPRSLRAQGHDLGCAQFARVEGMTAHGRSIYFCATNGGPETAGQVWKIDAKRNELSLVVQPDDRALLEGPDNLVVAPWGDLVICEDGRNDDFVVGVTPQGRLYPIARNAHNDQELAGACFSPDGSTLFVNIQEPGLTFAIWGPWSRRQR
jgi:secreted PhoX family phosphatase